MNTKDIMGLSPQIKELISKIEKAQVEIAFCTTAFNGNTNIVLQELKEMKKQSVGEYKELETILAKFKNTCDTLESIARIISLTPEKVNEKLSEFPENFNNSITNSLPHLSTELSRTLESGVESFTNKAEATLNATNSQMSSAVQKLIGNTDQLHYDMRNELNTYSVALDKIIDKGSQFRMRSFFWTVLLSSTLSSAISITAFWLIGRA